MLSLVQALASRCLLDIRFYLLFALLALMGGGLTYLPNTLKTQIRTFYDANVDGPVRDALRRHLPTDGPSTLPATTATRDWADRFADQIRAAACPTPGPTIVDVIRSGDVQAIARILTPIVIASAALAAITVVLYPRQKNPVAALRDPPPVVPPRPLLRPRPRRDDLSITEVPATSFAQEAERNELRLRARQGRTAMYFAIGSGVATVVFHPQRPTLQFFHMPALCVLALGIGAWSVASYALWPVRAGELAIRTAFAGVFTAGAIALCISLPYQTVSPTGSAMTGQQVGLILVIRLIALPIVAAGSAFLTVHSVRRSKAAGPVPVMEGPG